MRVLFCGGGTAGHVNPAIAVAETIMRNSYENKVAYVVTSNGIENSLVDFKKYSIDVTGLKRSLSLKNVSFFVKQMKAIEKCKDIIKSFHPDVIFGTGGYATFPVIYAGHKMGIKTVLHESNAIPGKAILALEGKADSIFVNFTESREYFKNKDKVIHTGNPLRGSFTSYDKQRVRKDLGITQRYVILCTGGSLGAERINNGVIEIIDNLICERDDIFLVWSAGRNEYEKAIREMKRRNVYSENVLVKDYFSDISRYIAASDLVISRAGAMTISELAFMKKATIFIPSPNVTNNHQYINAKTLERAGAALLLEENRIYQLIDLVKRLLENEGQRAALEEEIGKYAKNDANKIIYNYLNNM